MIRDREREFEKRSFVYRLFDNALTPILAMDLQTAERDLEYFRAYDWEVPEDLTAEEYMEIWNELREEQIREAEEELAWLQ